MKYLDKITEPGYYWAQRRFYCNHCKPGIWEIVQIKEDHLNLVYTIDGFESEDDYAFSMFYGPLLKPDELEKFKDLPSKIVYACKNAFENMERALDRAKYYLGED